MKARSRDYCATKILKINNLHEKEKKNSSDVNLKIENKRQITINGKINPAHEKLWQNRNPTIQ